MSPPNFTSISMSHQNSEQVNLIVDLIRYLPQINYPSQSTLPPQPYWLSTFVMAQGFFATKYMILRFSHAVIVILEQLNICSCVCGRYFCQ